MNKAAWKKTSAYTQQELNLQVGPSGLLVPMLYHWATEDW